MAIAQDPRPLSFLTVTTRDPDMPLHDFCESFRALTVRLRRRYGRVDYYGTIEGTSGRYAKDKRRRMHGHYILKGITESECQVAELLARQTWERSTLRRRGEVGRSYRVTLSYVKNGDAAALYLGGYLGKDSQVMDGAWGGRRVRPSQGFYPNGRVATREEAESQLIAEVIAHKEGLPWNDPAVALYRELQWVLRQDQLEARVNRKRARAELAVLIDGMTHDTSVNETAGRVYTPLRLFDHIPVYSSDDSRELEEYFRREGG